MAFGLFSPASTPSNPGTTGLSNDFFKEYDAAMLPALEASKIAAEDRYKATVDMTEAALAHLKDLQSPITPAPVPEVNPLAAAAASFFGGLNQMQTGSGQIPALVNNTLAQTFAEQRATQEANVESANRFALAKEQSAEELHGQLLQAKRDLAIQAGNLDEAFQHNKALYALQRQQKKDELAAAERIATGKGAQTQADMLARIAARGREARLTGAANIRLRKSVESHAVTPAQRARLAGVNAQVQEIRAQVDDARGLRDIAGEPVYSQEEIATMNETAESRIKSLYQEVIAEFDAEKTGNAPPPGGAPQTPPAALETGSDRVKAAADRLRGTPLFQQ